MQSVMCMLLKEVISFTDEATGAKFLWCLVIIFGYNDGRFGTKILEQNANLKHIADFKTEIASSRTFSFYMN
jgi:UDP-3-O-[3-hydroxymyristoyl] N-acetylglucosamine deacetylase/3-hydroxyacyl-[acyl-carrier-protein] dehydratase